MSPAKKRKHGKPIGEVAEGMVRDMAATHTVAAIARTIGASDNCVRSHLKRMGLTPKRGSDMSSTRWWCVFYGSAGMPPAEVGEKMGITRQAVEAHWKRYGLDRKAVEIVVAGKRIAWMPSGITALRRALVDEALRRERGGIDNAAALLGVTAEWLRAFVLEPWGEPPALENLPAETGGAMVAS